MMLNVLAWLLVPFISYAGTSPLARSSSDEQVITRANYTLSYNEEHEVANWVAYPLGHKQLKECVDRSNNFRIDPLISSGSSSPADYVNSGYDRGHLLPAGDMKFDKTAMNDTFYMSNMTPQPSIFNRGRWSLLETLIRAWGLKYKDILVVTGPVLKTSHQTIGTQNQVSVPIEYFKVILRKVGNSYKGIGFLMGVHVPYNNLSAYALSINEVEDYAGIDFFHFLDDAIEEKVESEHDLASWDFGAKFTYLPCSP